MTKDAPSPSSTQDLEMPPRQRRFVEEYLIDLNATQAFLRAGYAPANARRSAWALLQQPAVRAAIEAGQRQLATTIRVRAERVIAEYVRVAFASVRDYLDIAEDGSARLNLAKAPPDNLAAIADIRAETEESPDGRRVTRLRIRLAPKLPALDALSRHLNLFAPRADARPPDVDGAGERDLAEEVREARERAADWHSRFARES